MSSVKRKLARAYTETRRILRLTRKPKRSEYTKTAKITGLGSLLIGFLGFLIFLISKVLE